MGPWWSDPPNCFLWERRRSKENTQGLVQPGAGRKWGLTPGHRGSR